MQEEKNTEIVEEIAKDSSLDLARKALRKNVRIGRITKICSITIPILIGIILIGFPIIMHNINVSKNDRYWKSMISSTEINYNELLKEVSETIEEINDKSKGKFYWIGNVEVTETYVLKQGEKIIVIEEHYLYEGIECILYIKNRNSIIEDIDNDYMLDKNYLLMGILYIDYSISENNCNGRFSSEYEYYLTIHSTDTSTIETILSNLRNN